MKYLEIKHYFWPIGIASLNKYIIKGETMNLVLQDLTKDNLQAFVDYVDLARKSDLEEFEGEQIDKEQFYIKKEFKVLKRNALYLFLLNILKKLGSVILI